MRERTSDTHPIRVDFVGQGDARLLGKLGMTLAPGVKDDNASGGPWKRDLDADLRLLKEDYGVDVLVPLLEDEEYERYGIPDLLERAEDAGIEVVAFPIEDVRVPKRAESERYAGLVERIVALLRSGKTVVVHCRGGLGRTGTVVASVLVALGHPSGEAIKAVRHARPGTIETPEQERYVRLFEKERRKDHTLRTSRGGRTTPPEEPTQIERYKGSLLGLAVGDALGTTLEFQPPGSFRPLDDMVGGGPFGLKPGEWTDDTSMALCLAESLIERRGFYLPDQLEKYLRWYREGHMSSTGRCFDIGGATKDALERFEGTRKPYSGSTDPDRAGNGSLMRLAPVPLFYSQVPLPESEGADPVDAIERSGESSRTTHGARTAVDACRYMGALIAGAIRGASKEELLSERYSPAGSRYWGERPLVAEVDEVASGSFKRREPPRIRGRGYVVASLEAALWAFHNSDSFEEGVLRAVNLGEDADTTGAIYGQLAGAFYGEKGIPKHWRYRIAHRLLIEYFADRLFNLANTGDDGKRKLRRIEAAFTEFFSNWGITLPPEDVRERRQGKIAAAGWAIWYRFGSDERGEYLDYYASHPMMGGDEHTRVREDGSVEGLDAISSVRRVSNDPEEDARLEAEHRQKSRRVAEVLEGKGFGMEGDEPGGVQINRFLALGGTDEV